MRQVHLGRLPPLGMLPAHVVGSAIVQQDLLLAGRRFMVRCYESTGQEAHALASRVAGE